MNILDIVDKGSYMLVITDDNRGQYAYPKDKFKNLAQLEKEMAKSAAMEKKRNMKRLDRFDRVMKEKREKYNNAGN